MKRSKFSFVFIILFPLLAIMLCLLNGHGIWEVYLPAGWISDEVSYYKQIEGMLDYGMPQGFWGYYESTAKIGTFGPWSFLAFLPYAIPGFLFGWNFFMPILCNCLFLAGACAAYVWLAKPSTKEVLWMVVGGGVLPLISRYELSMMLEAYVTALLILLTGLIKSSLQHRSNKKSIAILICVFLLSIPRPYFVVLFFLPLFFSENKKRIKWFLLSFVLLFLAVMVYIFVNEWFCADYVTSALAGDNMITGLRGLIKHALAQLQTVFYLLRKGGAMYGYGYLLMLVVLISLFLSAYISYKEGGVSVILCLHLYMAGAILAIFASILILYDPYAGARHISQAALVGWWFIMACTVKTAKPRIFSIVAGIVVFLLYWPSRGILYQIPFRNTVPDAEILQTELAEVVSCEAGEPWRNTLLFDRLSVDYNLVYYLPSFLGIQLMSEDFFEEKMPDSIKSAYLMTAEGSVSAEYVEDAGWNKIYYNEERGFCIYQKPLEE